MLRTVEERSDNPRVVWNAMLVSTRLQSSSDATFTSEQFSNALKRFGTGIQLTQIDVELILGTAPISFAQFTAFVTS